MQLGAITMVRDEADILLHTLRHLRAEGVTQFSISDNLSVDGTDKEIQVFHDETMPAGDPRDWTRFVAMYEDREIGYYQSRKMTNLYEMARLYPIGGPLDWVIPFDADELWYVSTGETIAEYLETIPADVHALQAKVFNYFGTTSDPNGMVFERIQHRDPEPAALPKTMFRAVEGVTIGQGNHAVYGPEPWNVQPSKLCVAHFPWRSSKQFERKVRNGYEAYQATDLPDEYGSAWRQHGQILEDQGPEVLRTEVFERWFRNPPIDLEFMPAPYRRDDD